MEILHRGIAPSERTHEATCSTCKTKIRFVQHEAKYNSDQREGDYLSITCPVCSHIITKQLNPRSSFWDDR
jgi:RNase P subunit RPR2